MYFWPPDTACSAFQCRLEPASWYLSCSPENVHISIPIRMPQRGFRNQEASIALAVSQSGARELRMSLIEIESAIPHRPPFLLLDEIMERSDDTILCRKTFQPD